MGQQDNMAIHICRNQLANMNFDAVYTINIGDARFNGVRSIEKDMYFALGCVCLTATSIKTYGEDNSTGYHESHFETTG